MDKTSKIINEKNRTIAGLTCQVNELKLETIKLKSVISQLQYEKGNLMQTIRDLKRKVEELTLSKN